MVTEIAHITIEAASAADFEAAVAQAVPFFRAADGCRGFALQRVLEDPTRYQLVVRWDTLEHHTVGFRNSENFLEWRRLASPFFAKPPVVEHCALVEQYF
jgi:heme-degrading monooxygenase HmoA